MTDLATTFNSEQETAVSPSRSTTEPTTRSTMEPTTLITEEQVRFSTAAAVALPPAKTRGFGDVVHELAEKVRAMFASSEKRPAKKHYPKRYDFLEDARMAREMDRL